jgi:hypothetical protein
MKNVYISILMTLEKYRYHINDIPDDKIAVSLLERLIIETVNVGKEYGYDFSQYKRWIEERKTKG